MKRIILTFAILSVAFNSFAQFCAAGAGCDEYISNVEIGAISNSTGCSLGGYTDYSAMSTDIVPDNFSNITVTNGKTIYSSDQCGIWVDWNNNGDFTDDPAVTVTGTPGVGPYTATINCPNGTTLGDKRMRIRILYTGTVSPCGTTSYGEVEDYTLHPPHG